VGEVIPTLEDPERYAFGLLGLEARRLSLWRSASRTFTGGGVSSITSTQPDVSPRWFPFGSLLCRESILRRMLSRLVFAVVGNEADEEEEELPKALGGDTAGLARPVILPILNRGTRV